MSRPQISLTSSNAQTTTTLSFNENVLYSAQPLKRFVFVFCDVFLPFTVALKAKNIHNPPHSLSFAKEPTDRDSIVPVFNI